MRILQLCGDWKWTGPAEPMLVLMRALRERGHHVDLACASPPVSGERSLAAEAERRGLSPIVEFVPGRGARWRRDAPVATQLRELVRVRRIEIVHTWHTRDHVLALRTLGARRGRRTIPVVRSTSVAEPPAPWPWNRWLFGPASDALVCVSPESARAHESLRGGLPVTGCFGAVERDRLMGSREAGRAALGLDPMAPVVGIVARVQRHRRFDLLFEAMARLSQILPTARLVVVGRGTHFDEVARAPVARLGLTERVVLAGYHTKDYTDVLRAFDVFTYLVPGSDGTCRALVEAAACGIPAVASRRGALPEIVADGETGILVDETPDALAGAWKRLLGSAAERDRMGRAASARAVALFDPARAAAQIEAVYANVYSPSPSTATSSR